jgi:hypothetical protein
VSNGKNNKKKTIPIKFSGVEFCVCYHFRPIFSIVMPIVTREVTLHLEPGLTANASLDLSNLGFLLGTFPSAPGILFYAIQYNVAVDMVWE